MEEKKKNCEYIYSAEECIAYREKIDSRFIFTPFVPIISGRISEWMKFSFYCYWIETQQIGENLRPDKIIEGVKTGVNNMGENNPVYNIHKKLWYLKIKL